MFLTSYDERQVTSFLRSADTAGRK